MIIKPKEYIYFTDKATLEDRVMKVEFLNQPTKHRNAKWNVDMFYITFRDLETYTIYNITLYSSLASQFQCLISSGFIQLKNPYHLKVFKAPSSNERFVWAFDISK